jgi:hypothetical protein
MPRFDVDIPDARRSLVPAVRVLSVAISKDVVLHAKHCSMGISINRRRNVFVPIRDERIFSIKSPPGYRTE